MPLPPDENIQAELMRLLLRAPEHRMQSADVYPKLADSFPALTNEEKTLRYQNSVSHWANRVQFAVLHLRKLGWLSSPHAGERGVWEVTPEGKKAWPKRSQIGDELLRELDAL